MFSIVVAATRSLRSGAFGVPRSRAPLRRLRVAANPRGEYHALGV